MNVKLILRETISLVVTVALCAATIGAMYGVVHTLAWLGAACGLERVP